jgi:Carboxypeptidase regulatory-like domain
MCSEEAILTMKRLWSVKWLLAVLLLLVGPALRAQQFSGVNGIVSDKSGGIITGVDVTLDNAQLGIHLTTQTNDIGFYQFLKVTPNESYQLTFVKDGFQKLVLDNIALQVASVETHNVTLQVGSLTQTVEVQSNGGATLNTTDATVGNVIDAKSVAELPLQLRLNPANLMLLQAGVNDAGAINGSRSDQGNITLDGIDINDQATGQAFTPTLAVSIDSLQEVRTITAGETADFGRSSGGDINFVTKGGSNDWHGNAREYFRSFPANDWFNNRDGVHTPHLVRNQFGGSLGGPIKKDKLFFFFDYEGLRRASSEQIERSVPTDAFRSGELSYINSNPGCDGTARLNINPTCITTLTAAQVATLDPLGLGANSALLGEINARYPEPNDPAGGDGVNSEGYRFTAPAHESENLYTGRVDWNFSDKNKFFFRGSVDRHGIDDDFNTDIVQFPGDPAPNSRDVFNSYAFSVGWTWSKSATLINQFSAGLVRTILTFPALEAPTYPNEFDYNSSTFGGPLSNPYLPSATQSRNVPVPEFRDGLSWTKGKHSMEFGTDIKLIRQISALKNDLNFIGIGLGGATGQLDATLRPADINQDPSAISNWDDAFPFDLGRYSSVTTNFNYTKSGDPLPNGTGKSRYYNYNEFEFYAQDSWKARSDLTISYGLRWDFHTVPYEINGFESIPSVNENVYLADRVAAAAAGISGNSAIPLVSYSLGGSANGKTGYYNPDYKNFGPRIGIAWNPSFRSGLLNSIFGDRKTTVRLGGSILYDRIAGGASFGLDQNTFLFDSQSVVNFGAQDPTVALATDPRFAGFKGPFPAGFFPTAPSVAAPNTPNLDANGNPIGLSQLLGFPSFFQFDRNVKTPYSDLINVGIQRELPGNFLFEANYVLRLGRRLLAVGDAATTTNFLDSTSGQFLKSAFAGVQQQVETGVPIGNLTPQPWFENQMGGTAFCQTNFGGTCTQVAAANLGQFFQKGDLSSVILYLSYFGLLSPNVGLPAQTGANGYIGNYASSNYNGLLLTLRKRISHGLQFDFNYTYSHSIDNMSEITNNYVTYTGTGAGLVCDLENLRTCRASSDFDARHLISANYVYDLPFGNGREFGRNAPKWVDFFIGGWSWSGIVSYRTGYPFTVHSGAFPTAFTLDSPALLSGPTSALQASIHTEGGNTLQFFKNVNTALNSLSFPQGGDVGTRNDIIGPGFFNIDMGVSKSFKMPWSEKQRLRLRMDTFNTLNHPSFNPPGTNNGFTNNTTLSNTSTFGIITSTASTPRVLQFALRYEF